MAKNAGELKVAVTKAVKTASAHNLEVGVLKNGKLISAMVYVLKASSTNKIAQAQSHDQAYARLNLEPGTYDLKVVDEWADTQSSVQLSGVKVSADRVTKVKAKLDGGKISVNAYKNGKRLHADVFVYSKGSEKQLANNQSREDGPAIFKLAPGVYDLKIKDEWGSGEFLMFKNIKVESGRNKSVKAEFVNGVLAVTVTKGGKIYVADVFVFRPGEKKYVENKATRKDITMTFELLVGTYDIKIKDEWGDGTVKWVKGAQIKPGKTTSLKVTLP